MEDHSVTLSPNASHSKGIPDHARYRSETVIKERPSGNSYSSVRAGEGSAKQLPSIKFATPHADKDLKSMMFSKESGKYFRTIVDKALDQAKADKIYDQQNSSFRNYYKAHRSNQTTMDGGSLPKLNIKIQGHHHHQHHHKHNHSVLSGGNPLTTDRKLPLDGGFRIPTPLLCKRYHKVFHTNANNSPRDDKDQLS